MGHDHRRIALVTGANRGIGLEIARQLAGKGLHVILGVRSEKNGRDACGLLSTGHAHVSWETVNVSDPASVERAVNRITERFGQIDVLVNNAGIRIDLDDTVMDVTRRSMVDTFETNVLGALYLCQACIPMMKTNNYGRIVNMSSELGSLHDMSDRTSSGYDVGSPAYRISKTALNGLTALFARETSGTNILVNSACPGWVRTDLGGDGAPFSPAEGADTPVWLATLPDNGPNGGFFQGRKQIEW